MVTLQSSTSLPIDDIIEKVFRTLIGNPALYDYYCARADLDRPDHLTRWERLAIFIYSKTDAFYYQPINEALRRGSPATDVQIICEILAQGLQKLPRHVGLVSRGVRVQLQGLPALVARYSLGTVVEWRAFSSCSADDKYAVIGNVLFIVQSKNGRSLGRYADDQMEQEVTFVPGSTFVVEGLVLQHDRAIISLVECDPPGDSMHGDQI